MRIHEPDGKHGEFAVLVGDPWHGKGIGAVLLKKCLDIAKSRGFETITGSVLRENKNMLTLGKKLGFKIQKHSDKGECELTCTLVHDMFCIQMDFTFIFNRLSHEY